MRLRASGILLHVTSLPGRYGVGELGPTAYRFVDFLARAGQSYWQVLPINALPGGMGHSPYSALSAFAGHRLLISGRLLVRDGLLERSHLERHPRFGESCVDYRRAGAFKERLLKAAYERWRGCSDGDSQAVFRQAHRFWLDDYTLFMALRGRFGPCWWTWPMGLRDRRRKAMETVGAELAEAVDYETFVQYTFFRQWEALKAYAAERGVRIIGDIPMYAAGDSADVWVHRHQFKLTRKGLPRVVAGVPPDYFSRTGQKWGHPLYDWAVMRKDHYQWWMQRLAHNLGLFDRVRLDHFRAFVNYWQIPAADATAIHGRWVSGPAGDLLPRVKRRFGTAPFIVEDLGDISQEVRAAIRRFAMAGMRVLQFAFGDAFPDGPHLPEHYPTNCVAYTGTHDNNTTVGWFDRELTAGGRANLHAWLGRAVRRSRVHHYLIERVMASRAGLCILPMQDILGLDGRARMNTPGTIRGNWRWRMGSRALSGRLADRLAERTADCGRA